MAAPKRNVKVYTSGTRREKKKNSNQTGLLLGDQFEDSKIKHLSTKKHWNKRTRYGTGEGMG